MLNCLAAITSITAEQECCQGKHVSLIQDIQHHLNQLVDEEASQVLQRCGFKAQLQHNRYALHVTQGLLVHPCIIAATLMRG